ncbi:AAA family ATPase [Lacinutrix himadriensis]|uniref:AAA family ATPase n=1 Tax=Lacinutrix himadriensis TaxID=641549 RepID=UPI0006E2C48C|nr:AAA family ATPase [Lacinutrix himadriensis]
MEKIKISNFRKIKETWELDLAPITFFTGKNNSGKSSALKALMVLSDYTNSTIHFKLDFLGDNSSSHKIENYSNCINWKNNTKSNISFEYERYGHLFALVFSPTLIDKQDYFESGILESLSILNKQNESKIEFKRQGGESYSLYFNNRFLSRNNYLNESNEKERLKNTKKTVEKTIEKLELKTKKELGLSSTLPISSKNLIMLLGSAMPVVGIALSIAGLSADYKLKKIDEKTKINLKSELEKLTKYLVIINEKIKNINKSIRSATKDVIFSPSFELDKLSQNDLDLNNIFNKILISYFKDGKEDVGNIDVKDETIKLNTFSEELMDLFQFKVDHLSPHRYNQERLILNEGTSDDISKLAKKQINKGIKKGSIADEFIIKWMSEFDIGINYEIISIYGQASVINVFEEGIEKPINIADKGFGAGQIFTILLKIAQKIDEQKVNLKKYFYFPEFSHSNQVVIIEEPEANLHPALQAKLTDLFLDAYTIYGIRFILETHSEYMIRKSQLLNLENKCFKLYYFDEEGPYEMEYTKKGGFSRGFGKDFYDVNDNLALELVLKANS